MLAPRRLDRARAQRADHEAAMLNFEGPYCLIARAGKVHYARGPIQLTHLLAEVPRPQQLPIISMVPYAQLRERGFPVHDGGEPIITLQCEEFREIQLDRLTGPEWNAPTELSSGMTYNMSDAEFMAGVEAIIQDEIRNGEGSNFLLSRQCRVEIADFNAHTANTIFKRFVQHETGAYITFCFHDGERFFIGSSPERHVTIESGRVRMNPVCGTLPKAALHSRSDLIAFLTDPKEINELFQVVDEELKMMSRICRAGGEVKGPLLKEMSTLIHTEYLLEGDTDMDNIDAFRASMFAATMIGSPLENAARVIRKYERDPRRYYSSALMLLELDESGRENLDSAITIRTMEVSASGACVIQAGASIVRDSVAAKECQEIKAKAEAAVRTLAASRPKLPALADFLDEPAQERLMARNKYLSRFWMEKQYRSYVVPELVSRRMLIIDNEDEFTFMLKHAFEHLGLTVTLKEYDDPSLDLKAADMVLVGPGPGDPSNLSDDKMRRVHAIVDSLLGANAKFMAVCLGHQVLCHRLGLQIVKSDPPLQGVQKSVELFGRSEAVGFYNTFFALRPAHELPGIEIAAEPDGRISGLRAQHFLSFQFHVESVLTTNGLSLLRDALSWLTRG
jgi:phenazine biosynthesis protein phzE